MAIRQAYGYSIVYSLDAPSEAYAGEIVTITVTIKNTSTQDYVITAGIRIDGHYIWELVWMWGGTEIPWQQGVSTVPGQEITLVGTFFMPNRDIKVEVQSQWQNPYTGMWIVDDWRIFNITMLTPEPSPPKGALDYVRLPELAEAGSLIEGYIRYYNIGGEEGYLQPRLEYNGITLVGETTLIVPGDYWVFFPTFTMPAGSVSGRILVAHWEDPNWIIDDEQAFIIEVGITVAQASIVNVDMPSEAKAGDSVMVFPYIKNIGNATGRFKSEISYDTMREESGLVYNVEPGYTQVMPIVFVMPSDSISGNVYAYRRDEATGLYVTDDQITYQIDIIIPPEDGPPEDEETWWDKVWKWIQENPGYAIGAGGILVVAALWPRRK